LKDAQGFGRKFSLEKYFSVAIFSNVMFVFGVPEMSVAERFHSIILACVGLQKLALIGD